MFKCNGCKRDFDSRDELEAHRFMVKNGYHCPSCHSSNVKSEYDMNVIPYGDTTLVEACTGDVLCLNCGYRF